MLSTLSHDPHRSPECPAYQTAQPHSRPWPGTAPRSSQGWHSHSASSQLLSCPRAHRVASLLERSSLKEEYYHDLSVFLLCHQGGFHGGVSIWNLGGSILT